MGEVTLHDISKRFTLRIDGALQTVQALSRVNFTVRDGEIVSLIGPSGCGKTTALRIAMGLETASAGKVTVDGREVRGCGHDRGMVFQFAELLPWLTALQNVMFGLEMKGMRGAELRATARRYLELVGLSDSLNRRPHQLSGGMKQRVGIARALAIDPKVLLMDEPFGALDAQTRETMQAELLELHARTRKTILFVTHDLDEAVLIADRIVVMKDGMVQEIMTVPLKRPRPDLGVVRGTSEFADTRYRVWQALHAPIGTEARAVTWWMSSIQRTRGRKPPTRRSRAARCRAGSSPSARSSSFWARGRYSAATSTRCSARIRARSPRRSGSSRAAESSGRRCSTACGRSFWATGWPFSSASRSG